MSQLPLVTVICLCYNHERFLREALNSVLNQTYSNIEIIIVDDSSTDNSVNIISEYLLKHPQLKFIQTGNNKGNCAAFNMGLKASKGTYIIDFATDDVLLPDRVSKQVEAFQRLGDQFGVVYSDAEYISDIGEHMYYHSQRYKPAPNGFVFADVLGRYFICPPTQMIKKEVFEYLGGYDETLAYEDFDFWVRSAKEFKYYYLDAVTTKRRVHDKAMSRGLYQKGNKMLQSTLKVCQKAVAKVDRPADEVALAKRVMYEAKHAYLNGFLSETISFLSLYPANMALPVQFKILYFLAKHNIKSELAGFIYRNFKTN